MIDKIEGYITTFENVPMSVVGWISAMVGIVWVRIFLEAFSNPDVYKAFLDSALPTLLHCVLAYVAIGVVTVVAIAAATRIRALPMMRAIVFFMPVIWLGPIIDLFHGGGRIAYVFDTPSILLRDFFTFFGPLTNQGATLGLRVEFVIILIAIGTYVYVRTRRVLSTVIGMVIMWAILFVLMTVPSLLTLSGSILAIWGSHGILQVSLLAHSLYPAYNLNAYYSNFLLFDVSQAQIWYLVLCASGIAWLYQVRKDVLRAISQNIRLERLALFVTFGLLGALVALAEGSVINWTVLDFITIADALLVVTFAWVFAVATNDIVDEPIDAVSNADRPLITGTLTPELMRDVVIVSALLMLGGAFALGSYATFFVLLFTVSYYVYSVPPLRLKRVPILASALIGMAALAIMMFGFFLVSSSQLLAAFPAPLALLVVLVMTLIANVRDLKDIEGDSVAGIATLPTLLGDKMARMVIGMMIFVAGILVPLFIPVRVLWVPSLIAGALSWAGLVRGRSEKFGFGIFFIYLATVVILLCLS